MAGALVVLGVVATLLVSPRDEVASEALDTTDADLLALIASLDGDTTAPLAGAWELSLPRDFGAHAEARSETWNIVAHLVDLTGERLSVTMILSRLGATETDDPGTRPFGPGPVHISQVIVTSTDSALRTTADRTSRMAGTAGHDPTTREMWIDDWTLTYDESGLALDLHVQDRALRLSIAPSKEPLLPDGMTGGPTRAFAIPRLAVTGTLGSGADAVTLSGSAWLDRVWGDVPLPGGPLVRDRFVLHLSDGTDLSLLQTRRRDGRGIATMEGVLVLPDGAVRGVNDTAVEVIPVFTQDGDTIAGAWRIAGAGLEIEARVLDTVRPEGIGPAATVGLLSVEGTRDDRPVTGAGTVLLSSDGVS